MFGSMNGATQQQHNVIVWQHEGCNTTAAQRHCLAA
jgi:hypothetical protein